MEIENKLNDERINKIFVRIKYRIEYTKNLKQRIYNLHKKILFHNYNKIYN